MKKRTSIFNSVISYALLLGLFVLVLILCNNRFAGQTYVTIGLLISGALISALVNTFVHELGHILMGKLNGFSLISFTVWFFSWKKVKNKLKFSLVMLGDEAGYTEMLSASTDNLAKRFKSLSLGGIIASGLMTALGVVVVCLINLLPYEAFCLLGTLLPISCYYFLGNLLPVNNDGIYNDGAVVYGIIKNDQNSQVMISTLAIQCEMFGGKTPSEVDKKYYFEVPQLAEDNLNFIILLGYRYMYYLDNGELENANKTIVRLMNLIDYIPKSMQQVYKADALYEACTFAYDEERADELMYECDKFLNKINSATNVRIKMAYLKYVLNDQTNLQEFYKKGIKETKRTAIKGYGAFEKKLLDKLIEDVNVLSDKANFDDKN